MTWYNRLASPTRPPIPSLTGTSWRGKFFKTLPVYLLLMVAVLVSERLPFTAFWVVIGLAFLAPLLADSSRRIKIVSAGVGTVICLVGLLYLVVPFGGETFARWGQFALNPWPWFSLVLVMLIVLVALSLRDSRLMHALRAIEEFRYVLQVYVVPRRLTPDRKKAIVEKLRLSPPPDHPIILAARRHDEEALRFRSDIAEALQAGGWERLDTQYSDEAQLSAVYTVSKETETKERSYTIEDRSALRRLELALAAGGVRLESSGRRSGDTDSLVLHIGARRRDGKGGMQPWPFDLPGESLDWNP